MSTKIPSGTDSLVQQMAPRASSPTPSASSTRAAKKAPRQEMPADTVAALTARTPKIAPAEFHSDRQKLKAYMVQCELYMGFHVHKFAGDTEKVLWATSFLRGRAFDWIETFVSDYLKNVLDPSEIEQETRAIFGT